MAAGKREHSKPFWDIDLHPVCQFECNEYILFNYFLQVGFFCCLIRGIEEGRNTCICGKYRYFFRYFPAYIYPWEVLSRNLQQMELAALPRDTSEDCLVSGFNSCVIIAENQLNAMQTTPDQSFQKCSPMYLLFAQGHGNSQYAPLFFHPFCPPTGN